MEREDLRPVLLVILVGDIEGFACGEGFGPDVTAVTTIHPQTGGQRYQSSTAISKETDPNCPLPLQLKCKILFKPKACDHAPSQG